jgi:hypothetical protein
VEHIEKDPNHGTLLRILTEINFDNDEDIVNLKKSGFTDSDISTLHEMQKIKDKMDGVVQLN